MRPYRQYRYLGMVADAGAASDFAVSNALDDLMGEVLTDTINEYAPTLHARQQQLIQIGQALDAGQATSMTGAQFIAAVDALTSQADAAQNANPAQQAANANQQQIWQGNILPPLSTDNYAINIPPSTPAPVAPPGQCAWYDLSCNAQTYLPWIIGAVVVAIVLPAVIGAFRK